MRVGARSSDRWRPASTAGRSRSARRASARSSCSCSRCQHVPSRASGSSTSSGARTHLRPPTTSCRAASHPCARRSAARRSRRAGPRTRCALPRSRSTCTASSGSPRRARWRSPPSATTTPRARWARPSRSWRGPALADLADEAAVRQVAARLDELHLLVEERHVQAELGRGRHAEVLTELQRLVLGAPAARADTRPAHAGALPQRPPGGRARGLPDRTGDARRGAGHRAGPAPAAARGADPAP